MLPCIGNAHCQSKNAVCVSVGEKGNERLRERERERERERLPSVVVSDRQYVDRRPTF